MRLKIKHLIALNAFAAVVVAFPLFFGILAMLAFLTVVSLLILVVGVGVADTIERLANNACSSDES